VIANPSREEFLTDSVGPLLLLAPAGRNYINACREIPCILRCKRANIVSEVNIFGESLDSLVSLGKSRATIEYEMRAKLGFE
jgi:hypothetical protein